MVYFISVDFNLKVHLHNKKKPTHTHTLEQTPVKQITEILELMWLSEKG